MDYITVESYLEAVYFWFLVQCTPGTFADQSSNSCEHCLRGTYQDEVGQASCKVCPEHTSTLEDNAKSLTDCISMYNTALGTMSRALNGC